MPSFPLPETARTAVAELAKATIARTPRDFIRSAFMGKSVTMRAIERTGSLPALVGVGSAGWFAAAMMVKHLPSELLTSDAGSAAFFAFSPLFAVPAIAVGMRLSGCKDPLYTITVMTAAALMMDGVAVRWAPDTMYGSNVTNGAATIMFGAGAGIFVGMVWPEAWL